jgi:hypothetical protein
LAIGNIFLPIENPLFAELLALREIRDLLDLGLDVLVLVLEVLFLGATSIQYYY